MRTAGESCASICEDAGPLDGLGPARIRTSGRQGTEPGGVGLLSRVRGPKGFQLRPVPMSSHRGFVEGGEPESVSFGQRHEVRIRDVRMAGHRWDAIGAKIISDESAALARRQVVERSPCVARRRPVAWAQADAQEPKLGQRTGCKTGLPIEPRARLGMLSVEIATHRPARSSHRAGISRELAE